LIREKNVWKKKLSTPNFESFLLLKISSICIRFWALELYK
jgi:hypothetical protein